ncbi:MAG: TlpA family protein disulfide reductase [Defluviitaleaceae bacterium]|nr:TlpA family protein disulfide reductase [Defluviitaleaceae bacterium]
MKKILKFAASALAFIFLFVFVWWYYDKLAETETEQLNNRLAEAPAPTKEREKAPDFSLTDSDGNETTLHEILAAGKPTVINFWASWCPPCRIEMPDFDSAYAQLGENVQFIMLNLVDGVRETRAAATRFVADNGFSFPVYFDLNQSGAEAYAVRSIPTTVFIDENGYIANTVVGLMDERRLLAELEVIMRTEQ